MLEFESAPPGAAHTRIAILAAIVAVAGALGGYAIHEHSTAQNLAADNAKATATLNSTQHELSDLTARVNALAQRNETQSQMQPVSSASTRPIVIGHPSAARPPREDPRYKKLQSQLDAQGKAIDQTRTDLASTQGNLDSTRTELTGSIAHTHDELVVLQKRGERNYTEFDLPKSKEFKREGPIELQLKKANDKHQYADLALMVNDRNLSQKHVNLLQPVMFYTPDSPQPVEIVINDITKDHIHGYVSAPKYRQSELASMSSTTENGASNAAQGTTDANPQPSPRQKLPIPQ
jgi:hypothetical protein